MAEDPHANPDAARLALKLVEEQWGEVCKKLAAALVGQGMQTFPELLRTSALPPSQLKSALLVLAQHNCVNCYFHEEPPTLRGPGPSYQLYEAATDRILQIIRAPRFLTHVGDEMGSLAELVVHKLLENGRLRVEQLVHAVQSEYAAEGGEGGGDQPSAAELHAVFVSLVKAHYVERVPPCTLPPLPKELHPAARKKKPSLKTASEEEDATQRKQALSLKWQAYHQDRFKLPADLAEGMGLDAAAVAAAARAEEGAGAAAAAGDGDEEEEEEATGKGKGKGKGKGAAGGAAKRKRGGKAMAEDITIEEPAAKKRGRRKVKADEAVAPAGAAEAAAAGSAAKAKSAGVAGEASGSGTVTKPSPAGKQAAEPEQLAELRASEVLWRVNYEEFNRRFRNDEVVGIVRDKHGTEAAAVMAGMLIASSKTEQGVRIGLTAVLSEHDIAGATRRLNPDEHTIPSSISEVLRELEVDELQLVEFAGHGPGGAQYRVDVGGALRLARLLQLQSFIRDKFGPNGMRIWRALLMSGQLEQKQVADFAMLPKEQARQLLYSMVKAGYVSVQDVPRTADHAPSRTFYTFRIQPDAASMRLGAELYRAAANVHARLAHELAQRAEVLELLDLVTLGQAPRSVLGQREGELAQVKRVATLLESSLLHLDRMIALFNDM